MVIKEAAVDQNLIDGRLRASVRTEVVDEGTAQQVNGDQEEDSTLDRKVEMEAVGSNRDKFNLEVTYQNLPGPVQDVNPVAAELKAHQECVSESQGRHLAHCIGVQARDSR